MVRIMLERFVPTLRVPSYVTSAWIATLLALVLTAFVKLVESAYFTALLMAAWAASLFFWWRFRLLTRGFYLDELQLEQRLTLERLIEKMPWCGVVLEDGATVLQSWSHVRFPLHHPFLLRYNRIEADQVIPRDVRGTIAVEAFRLGGRCDPLTRFVTTAAAIRMEDGSISIIDIDLTAQATLAKFPNNTYYGVTLAECSQLLHQMHTSLHEV